MLYFWKSSSHSSDLSRDKKIYFGDPLLQTILAEHAPGLPFDKPAAVENALALSLYRSYEPSADQPESFPGPTRLHVWETHKPKEIDFVCGERARLELAEVKYRSHVGAADTLVMRSAFPGRPCILATKETLRLEGEDVWLPASLLLWFLG